MYLLVFIGVAVVNVTLFLPAYVINKEGSSFFPDFSGLTRKRSKGIWLDYNLDPWRMSIDVTLILVLAHVLKNDIFLYIVPSYYVFIQIFNLYHCSFRKIYGTHPAIVNDLKLLKTGLGFIYSESKSKLIINFLGGCIVLAVAYYAMYLFVAELIAIEFNTLLVLLTSALTLGYVYQHIKRGFSTIFDLTYRFNFFPFRVYKNISLSFTMLERVKSINEKLISSDSRKEFSIGLKPNIHMICIESYGSILMKDEFLKPKFSSDLENFENGLNENGFGMTSNLSESVSLVGPSWLAYTTLLLGTKISSNIEYEFLLADNTIEKTTFAKSLQKNGYRSLNLNPIKPRSGIYVPYDPIKNLYGIDDFILYDDILYEGKRYGISETPPEQYVLNYVRDEFLKFLEDPYFMFYLTKNSHSPFISPEMILKDWRTLNDGKEQLIGNKFLKIPSFDDYRAAIKYQLSAILDYISGFDPQNNIFILIGDHQPHHIIHSDDFGLETPVHIISANESFLKKFEQYGFNKGLISEESPIKHENFRAILETELMSTFNEEKTTMLE